MITIEIDTAALKAVNDKITTMVEAIDNLKHVGIADELDAWQTEDMRRKRAATRRRFNGGSTLIRQHSWWETKGRKRVARRLIRKGRYVARRSTRPVLRAELLDKLHERMAELVHITLQW